MISLLMVSAIVSPAEAPTGGVVDVLQVGRSAIVVNIDRSQLPQDLCHETVIVSLIRATDRTTLTDSTDTDSLTLSLIGLPGGTYTIKVMVSNQQLAKVEIAL